MNLVTLIPVVQLPAAISMDSAFGSDIVQMILHAGLVVKFVMLILCVFSITSWAIIFAKWRLLRNANQETTYFLELFWEGLEWHKIFEECAELRFSPIAHLFKSGYSELKRIRKLNSVPKSQDWNSDVLPLLDNVERSLKKTTIDQGSRLEKAVSFLATTGNTAPFIGLFGTVWGIMESFRGIGLKGSASLAVVAPGISEALIATAAGLAAAIPAVIAFNYFNNRIIEIKSEMDTFSSDFLSLVGRQLYREKIAAEKGNQ